MKVFLSWSGDLSHGVAKILKDWLSSVIQSLEPYVSSEDIDKGARWSVDIAKELNESSFGILCVTSENYLEPWLNFEAGALSKSIDKDYVCPFLFNVKPTDFNGPITQFQATSFVKNDIEKLIKSLNKASENPLKGDLLSNSFERCWVELEKKLNNLKANKSSEDGKTQAKKPTQHKMVEEILELTRDNQKLIRQSNDNFNMRDEMSLESFTRKSKNDFFRDRGYRYLIHELSCRKDKKNFIIGLSIIVSLFKNDLPWIHDAGLDLINTLKSQKKSSSKQQAIKDFLDLLEYTLHSPIRKIIRNREFVILIKEFTFFIEKNAFICYDIQDENQTDFIEM